MNTERLRGGKHSIGGLFIFLLIGVFTVFSLLLVLIGVGAYQGVVGDAQENARVRTTLNYIANKVRAADAVGAVTLEEWHGIQTLLIREEIDGAQYETRIYYLPDQAGKTAGLYEHFVHAGDEWGPEEGDHIVDIDALDMRQEQGLIVLNLTTKDGQALELHLRLRASSQ